MTPNKTVFITGASRGIGRAIAIRFAAAGYQLALCCRQNTQLLEDLQQLIISQLSYFHRRYRRLPSAGSHDF